MDESIERYVNAVNITNGPYDVTFEFSISSPAGIVRPGTVPTMVKKDVVVIRTSHMLARRCWLCWRKRLTLPILYSEKFILTRRPISELTHLLKITRTSYLTLDDPLGASIGSRAPGR